MTDIDAINRLLDKIVNDDAREPHGDDFGAWFSRATGGVRVTPQERRLMAELAELVRRDPAVAENLSAKDVFDEVVSTVIDGVVARDEGTFDAEQLSVELLERVRADYETWTVLWPVEGLVLPSGEQLTIGGLTLGALGAAQLAAIRQAVDTVGQTLRLHPDAPPGSARDFVVQDTEDLLASGVYWALATVYGRRQSVAWIMEERVTIALDVLRLFGLLVGVDPDRTHLGSPAVPAGQRMLMVAAGRHIGSSAAGSQRQRQYELHPVQLQRLRDSPFFTRASAVVGAAAPTELEWKLVLGMVQFGTASRLPTLEEKLTAYLAVGETLLARELGENDRKRWKRVGRRLALLEAFDAQQSVVELYTELYALRRYPAHFGHRSMRGRQVVNPAAVHQAKEMAYYAILLALQRSEGLATHDQFITTLDRELVARGWTPGRPLDAGGPRQDVRSPRDTCEDDAPDPGCG